MKTKRTLIVEDSQPVRAALVGLLEGRWPHAVTTPVASEAEALQALSHDDFDIAIVDLHLAQGSGLVVLKHLSQSAFHPFIIIFSDAPSSKVRDFCLAQGAHAFMDKTSDVGELIEVLHALH